MKKAFLGASVLVLAFVVAAASRATADDYKIDPKHSCVTFKVSHLGLSWIYGRFNDVDGEFNIDKADPGKSSFNIVIKADSIDTAVKQRDDHLRSDTFFDVKQFPTITFKSTSFKKIGDNKFEIVGDFTLHGVTKSLSFTLLGGREAEMPKGIQRTGYAAEFDFKRSDFGMKGFLDSIPDTVHAAVSFEGTFKKVEPTECTTRFTENLHE